MCICNICVCVRLCVTEARICALISKNVLGGMPISPLAHLWLSLSDMVCKSCLHIILLPASPMDVIIKYMLHMTKIPVVVRGLVCFKERCRAELLLLVGPTNSKRSR
jgi:hypothetical protein